MKTAGEHQTNADTKANGRPGSERRGATDLLGLDNLFSDCLLYTSPSPRD